MQLFAVPLMNFQCEEASLKSTLIKKEKKNCLLLLFLYEVKCQSSRSDLMATFKQVLGNLQFNLGDLDTFKQLTQCQKEKKSNITFHSLLIEYFSPNTFEMCTLKVNQVITMHKVSTPHLQISHVSFEMYY